MILPPSLTCFALGYFREQGMQTESILDHTKLKDVVLRRIQSIKSDHSESPQNINRVHTGYSEPNSSPDRHGCLLRWTKVCFLAPNILMVRELAKTSL